MNRTSTGSMEELQERHEAHRQLTQTVSGKFKLRLSAIRRKRIHPPTNIVGGILKLSSSVAVGFMRAHGASAQQAKRVALPPLSAASLQNEEWKDLAGERLPDS